MDYYDESPFGTTLTRLAWPIWGLDDTFYDVVYLFDLILWIGVVVTLAVLLARGLRRAHREGRWSEPLALGALFVAGLVLRRAFATFGPGDLWMNQAAAFTEVLRGLGSSPYGAAPIALVRLVFTFVGETFGALIWVGIVVGALAPVLLVKALRRLERSAVEAWVAGALLALHPLAVRFGGEANRGSQVIFLFVLCLYALSGWIASGRARWLVLGVVVGTLLCHSRPEGIMALAPLATFALWRSRGTRGRLAVLAAGLVIVALAAVPQLGDEGVVGGAARDLPFQSMRLFPPFSPETTFWVDPQYAGWALVALAAFGAVLGLLELDALVTSAALGLLVISYLTQSEPSGDLNLANVRYQTLALPCAVLTAAYAVGRPLALIPRRGLRVAATVAVLAVIVATTVRPLGEVTAPTTVDEEFRFVSQIIEELPRNSYILSPYDSHDVELGMRPPDWLFFLHRNGGRWLVWDPDEPLPDREGTFFYYQASSCYGRLEYPDPRPVALRQRCERALERFGDQPLRTMTLHNRRMAYEYYDGPIEVGLYAID